MQAAIIVGGGIGGLAAALALSRVGQASRVFEQAPSFSEVGAGLQLGPNAVRRLYGWGLDPALRAVACTPEKLSVRSARTGKQLGELTLGRTVLARYGAPYLTLHRADLHGVLLQTSRAAGIDLQAGQSFKRYESTPLKVSLHLHSGESFEAPCLIGADGLRSAVRQQMIRDGAPLPTGHSVFRCLIAQSDLPLALRSQAVTTWLGPDLHVVQYPVRGGDWMNVAVIVHNQTMQQASLQDWDSTISGQAVRAVLKQMCAPLTALIEALQDWRVWVGYERAPLVRAGQMAQGRVALLGDAAHPMRPYLAQGAGMAIEDAQALAVALGDMSKGTVYALQRYAQARYLRNAKVQAKARQNGRIFHAKGVWAWGRDVSIRIFGQRILDLPWLYAG